MGMKAGKKRRKRPLNLCHRLKAVGFETQSPGGGVYNVFRNTDWPGTVCFATVTWQRNLCRVLSHTGDELFQSTDSNQIVKFIQTLNLIAPRNFR